ncbi:hypothetical protein Nmel_008546 [Mimus melanotis]
MATETEWSCLICQDAQNDMASALPCDHQFCLGCLLQWTRRNQVCPLCSRLVETVRLSEWGEQDYLLLAVISPEESLETSSHTGAAPILLDGNSPHGPLVSPAPSPQGTLSPDEQGAAEPEPVGGLLPEVWARLFQQQQHLLDPVRPWLCQRLETIFQDWWLVQVAQSRILHGLCLHGLNVENLIQTLQNCLGEHTAPLVHGLIHVIVAQGSEEAQRLLLFHIGREDTDSPVASASSSSMSSSSQKVSANVSARLNMDEETGTSEVALQGCPRHHPLVPIPAEWDQPQAEPEHAVVAGPSAQGSICSQVQGWDQSHREPRCAQKRRASSPQDFPPLSKKPRQAPEQHCSPEGLSSEEVMNPGASPRQLRETTASSQILFPYSAW